MRERYPPLKGKKTANTKRICDLPPLTQVRVGMHDILCMGEDNLNEEQIFFLIPSRLSQFMVGFERIGSVHQEQQHILGPKCRTAAKHNTKGCGMTSEWEIDCDGPRNSRSVGCTRCKFVGKSRVRQ